MIFRAAVVATAALGLIACSEQKTEQQTTAKVTPTDPVVSEAKPISVPLGRWLINDHHCANQLDIRALKDFTLHRKGIEKGQRLYSGSWEAAKESPLTIAAIKPSDTSCIKTDGMAQVSQLTTADGTYTFQLNEDKSVGVMHYKHSAHIIVAFDETKLSNYEPILEFEAEEG